MLPRILIVDDESSICISLSLALEPEYEVIWETDPIRALERLQTEPIDLVLLDMVIGPYDGLDILMKIKKLAPLAAVIMMTAYGSIRSSVSAMARGAFTYLTKPLDLEELKIYIRQALEFRSLNENVTYLNDQLEAQNQAEELIGTSPALEQVRTMLRKFQNVDVNVLITGESGTGKRIAAHTLHNGADGRRFVTVNCAAFDEKRLEEEFFGYKMDAVPGALCDRRGKLDYANGGTLYLDGIGDMPPEFQRKLLRVFTGTHLLSHRQPRGAPVPYANHRLGKPHLGRAGTKRAPAAGSSLPAQRGGNSHAAPAREACRYSASLQPFYQPQLHAPQ